MDHSPGDIARAYDSIADEYDVHLRDDERVRQYLWDRYAAAFPPGGHVLDVGCGTGTDTLFLAHRGVRVTAIDVSPKMIEHVKRAASEQGFEERVEAYVLDFNDLRGFSDNSFDGLVSGFAALNTVPDLKEFSGAASRILKPGGILIAHFLNRPNLTDWLKLVLSFRLYGAFRWRRQNARSVSIGSGKVAHYLSSPRKTYKEAFAAEFQLSSMRALQIVGPPRSDSRVPRAVLSAFQRADELMGASRLFLDWGRFYVLELKSKKRHEA